MGSSISTTRGDNGQTGLAGGSRVSKASLRVDTYGNVDELNATLGFARSICEDTEIVELSKRIQRDLFTIGSSLATPPASPKPQVAVTTQMVDALTAEVHRFRPSKASSPTGPCQARFPSALRSMSHGLSAVARNEGSCASSRPANSCSPQSSPYLNRLSDLIWIVGRKLEHDAGVSGSLREITGKVGNRFSRAW